jgi:hypothetical protein
MKKSLKDYLKGFGLQNTIILIGLFIFASGIIGLFYAPLQFVFKKVFLVSLWYSLAYIFRILRIGHIEWDADARLKVAYYLTILLSSSIIIAFG